MRRKQMQGLAIPAVDISKLGVANACRILQHGCEHRLEIAGRAADDLEHLRRRRLLLQRFGEVGGALAQLVQQPRILNGDDGLGGKVRDQLDLLVGEGTNFLAGQGEGANQFAFFQHRHGDECPYAAKFHGSDRFRNRVSM